MCQCSAEDARRRLRKSGVRLVLSRVTLDLSRVRLVLSRVTLGFSRVTLGFSRVTLDFSRVRLDSQGLVCGGILVSGCKVTKRCQIVQVLEGCLTCEI